MVRDRLVLGCQDEGAQARLFREKDCNLKALETLLISEATQEQLKDIGREDKPISINEAQKRRPNLPVRELNTQKSRCANTAVQSTKQAEPNVQHISGKICQRCRKSNHFHTAC